MKKHIFILAIPILLLFTSIRAHATTIGGWSEQTLYQPIISANIVYNPSVMSVPNDILNLGFVEENYNSNSNTIYYPTNWDTHYFQSTNGGNIYFYKSTVSGSTLINSCCIDSNGNYQPYYYARLTYIQPQKEFKDYGGIDLLPGHTYMNNNNYGGLVYVSNGSNSILQNNLKIDDNITYGLDKYIIYDSQLDALLAAEAGESGKLEINYDQNLSTPYVQLIYSLFGYPSNGYKYVVPNELIVSNVNQFQIRYRLRLPQTVTLNKQNQFSTTVTSTDILYSEWSDIINLDSGTYYLFKDNENGDYSRLLNMPDVLDTLAETMIFNDVTHASNFNYSQFVSSSKYALVGVEISVRNVSNNNYSNWIYVNTLIPTPFNYPTVSDLNQYDTSYENIPPDIFDTLLDSTYYSSSNQTTTSGNSTSPTAPDYVGNNSNIDFTQLNKNLNSIFDFVGNIPNMIGQLFSFLPEWLLTLLAVSIALVIIIGVVKALL